MQIEAISVVLRPRSIWEGCDLGVRLLQSWLRPVYRTYLAVALPLFALCLLTDPIAGWLPTLLIWLSKPWLDRTALFALSRALFGQRTTLEDLWDHRREVWLTGLATALTSQRLSASRSFKQPILQLEGLSGAALGSRVRQLTARHRGTARAMTVAFANAEFALTVSALSLQIWLSPHASEIPRDWLSAAPEFMSSFKTSIAYAAAVAFLEPFYVAAGFGMYINRRVELEAWDIEQEFRRAFSD
ncbi:MAG: hypothetical protein ABSD02_15650 [Steroidobacteraceae bacterium]